MKKILGNQMGMTMIETIVCIVISAIMLLTTTMLFINFGLGFKKEAEEDNKISSVNVVAFDIMQKLREVKNDEMYNEFLENYDDDYEKKINGCIISLEKAGDIVTLTVTDEEDENIKTQQKYTIGDWVVKGESPEEV
jgi:type II secretory pathway pseudopilin PulG